MLDRSLRDRYSRQTALPFIGEAGQARLVAGTAVIIGCGALGSNIASLLVRAGVGAVRIVDRDFIEYHNLQRQVLFDEGDIKARLPKAAAAERHLSKVNSSVKVEGIVADANYTNIERFCRGADVILDGLDNSETRLLVNDVALKHGVPFVYGSAIASSGMTMTVIPGETPCYRCIRPVLPDRAAIPTCETAGIIGTVPAVIGALEATEAIKILVGSTYISRGIIMIDMWKGSFERVAVKRRESCPACHGRYDFLEDRFVVKATPLCGQSRAVQVVDSRVREIRLDQLATRLRMATAVVQEKWALRFNADGHEITVFPDGRAIIGGTTDESLAKDLYAKLVAGRLPPQAE